MDRNTVHADHHISALSERAVGREDRYWLGSSKVQQIFKMIFNLGSGSSRTAAISIIYSPITKPLGWQAERKGGFYRAIPLPTCRTSSTTPSLWEIPSSCGPGDRAGHFPRGNARLFRSIKLLLRYPPETRLFMCHDYPPASRQPQWESTVADQRARNIHVHEGVTENDYVAMRVARDKTLGIPTLLLPSVQVNVRAGEMPPPEDNCVSYLKIPLNVI
jgi:hypothetical protein